MKQRWWLLLERAQATLPLIAVAGLAGFSWWLVQSSPKARGPVRPPVQTTAPDYELLGARVARFNGTGHIEAIIDGSAMRHYPSTDTLVIDQVEVSARNRRGEGIHAVARQGEADQLHEVLTLKGQARVQVWPAEGSKVHAGPGGVNMEKAPVRFEGEGLRMDSRQRLVSSDMPVTLFQAHNVLHAQSLRYDERSGLADLGGRVTGHYLSSGGMFTKGQP
jgi:lipopolysaccharide export system protein LptC